MVAPAFAALVEYADGRLPPRTEPGLRVVLKIRMTSEYLTNWLYVWAFIVSGAALVVLILLFSKLINPDHPTPGKLAPYECGIPPVGSPWAPFAVRYYVFALLFLVFDVEAIFLFPWTLVFRTLGTAGFVEMMLFIMVLVWGLLYAWRKGALEWA
jgi:NADH:ubiquinone oxidoreductase subunit 3 (subunit A)